MEVKKVWMSPDTGKKSHYALGHLGGIVGILALAMLLVCGGTVLSFSLGGSRELFLLVLCLGVVFLVLGLAACVGRNATKNTTVFFLTDSDQLFVMDARRFAYHGRNLLDYISGTVQTQQFLRQMAQRPFVPVGADEVLKVEKVKENRSHYAIVCQARRPGRRTVKRTFFLVKGLED